MAPGIGHNSRTSNKSKVTFYPAYHFRANEQDPVIDKMRSIAEQAGTIDRPSKMHELTGLSVTTFNNWFVAAKVRRPQYCSIAAFARAHGYDIALVKTSHKVNGKPWIASAPRILSQRNGGGAA